MYCGQSLDRETQDQYNLKIIARDGGMLSRSATAELTVTVLDVNDNTPKFSQDYYDAHIRDLTPAGENN